MDYLAITFDMLKQDLKDDVVCYVITSVLICNDVCISVLHLQGKEAFLLYHGVAAILCFLKPAYKVE